METITHNVSKEEAQIANAGGVEETVSMLIRASVALQAEAAEKGRTIVGTTIIRSTYNEGFDLIAQTKETA